MYWKIFKLFSLFVLVFAHFQESTSISYSEKVTTHDEEFTQGFSLANYVTSFGYPIEVHHNIRTEDNYLLTLHRIPSNSSNAPIVFLAHGLASSAECWVILGPEKSLAFLLSNRGYDVWMANARGTLHSRKHVHFRADVDKEFWDFDWDHIGYHDMPASMNYILRKTGSKDLIYVGHSQGATALFVMLSSRAEMNNVVKLGVAMAPAVFIGVEGVKMGRAQASMMFQAWETLRSILRLYEFGPQLIDIFCTSPLFTEEICNVGLLGSLFAIGLALDIPQLNMTGATEMRKIFPISASMRQYMHFGQSILTGDFMHYDYGDPVINMQKYGSVLPPRYDLSEVTAPIALFRGNADTLVWSPNVDRLASMLPNVILHYTVPNILFNHLDFVIANDVVPLVYNRLFSLFEEMQRRLGN